MLESLARVWPLPMGSLKLELIDEFVKGVAIIVVARALRS
jgi:hypothetical protein